MVSRKDLERALKLSNKRLKTATKEELEAFILKANPPIPGLDPSWEERKYKKRQKKKSKG
jgi:hypothetical protein